MALTDHDPEDLASVGYASGWVDTDNPPIPARSARSLQAADIAGKREDAARHAREEARADMWATRYKLQGEQPPSVQDVLDRVGRRSLAEDAANAKAEQKQDQADEAGADGRSVGEYMAGLKVKAGRKLRGQREKFRADLDARAEERKRKRASSDWGWFK